jgi:hypothetical protein
MDGVVRVFSSIAHWQNVRWGRVWEVVLTFFSAGSVTVSASLLSALRICEAATLVDVFSKACQDTNVSKEWTR